MALSRMPESEERHHPIPRFGKGAPAHATADDTATELRHGGAHQPEAKHMQERQTSPFASDGEGEGSQPTELPRVVPRGANLLQPD